MKRGQIALGIGMIVFSISVFLSHALEISSNIIDFTMGFGCGIEVLGIILIVIDNLKEKRRK